MIPRNERETIIRRMDDEEEWDVYTESVPLMNKFRRWLEDGDLKYSSVKSDTKEAMRVILPLASVSFRKPKSVRVYVQPENGWFGRGKTPESEEAADD